MKKLMKKFSDFIDSDTFLVYGMAFATLGMAITWCIAILDVRGVF